MCAGGGGNMKIMEKEASPPPHNTTHVHTQKNAAFSALPWQRQSHAHSLNGEPSPPFPSRMEAHLLHFFANSKLQTKRNILTEAADSITI